jgi:hypothetical protein
MRSNVLVSISSAFFARIFFLQNFDARITKLFLGLKLEKSTRKALSYKKNEREKNVDEIDALMVHYLKINYNNRVVKSKSMNLNQIQPFFQTKRPGLFC